MEYSPYSHSLSFMLLSSLFLFFFSFLSFAVMKLQTVANRMTTCYLHWFWFVAQDTTTVSCFSLKVSCLNFFPSLVLLQVTLPPLFDPPPNCLYFRLSSPTFSIEPRFSLLCTSTRALVSWVIWRMVAPSLPMIAPTISEGTSILEKERNLYSNTPQLHYFTVLPQRQHNL